MINSKDAKMVEDGNLQRIRRKDDPSSFKVLNGNHVNRDIRPLLRKSLALNRKDTYEMK
jgi:hypothetical protein